MCQSATMSNSNCELQLFKGDFMDAEEPSVSDEWEEHRNKKEPQSKFDIEVVPFKAIVLRDPVSKTIVKVLPFPYERTKTVRVYKNDIIPMLEKFVNMYFQYPILTQEHDIYQVWSVPLDFEPTTSYKLVIVSPSVSKEAKEFFGKYDVVPFVFLKKIDIEVWQIPTSCFSLPAGVTNA
jgi:hypothetical protein